MMTLDAKQTAKAFSLASWRGSWIRESGRALAFIARCSGAATAAFELATCLHFPESVWAAVSAVIVSQEKLNETRLSLTNRILGTLIGVAITILTEEIANLVEAPAVLQMAVSVGLSAVIVRRFSKLRVAMWTCPILLLNAQSGLPILTVGLLRGGEVILGATVGWIFHWAAEILISGIGQHRNRVGGAYGFRFDCHR